MGTQKSIIERKAYPAFQIVIEINERNLWTIHENVENSIDLLLREKLLIAQRRKFIENEKGIIKYNPLQTNYLAKKFESIQTNNPSIHESWTVQNINNAINSDTLKQKKLVIYIYSLS